MYFCLENFYACFEKHLWGLIFFSRGDLMDSGEIPYFSAKKPIITVVVERV